MVAGPETANPTGSVVGQDTPSQHAPALPHISALPPSDDGSMPRSNGTSFFDPGAVAPPAAVYPPLAFQDQPNATNNPGTKSGYNTGDNTAAYIYPLPTAMAQTGVADGVGPVANPLVAFATQATQHISSQTGGGYIAGGNPWQDWTAAVSENQDRYSANALLDLGAAHPRDVVLGQAPRVEDAVKVDPQTAQWPLLLFHGATGPMRGP